MHLTHYFIPFTRNLSQWISVLANFTHCPILNTFKCLCVINTPQRSRDIKAWLWSLALQSRTNYPQKCEYLCVLTTFGPWTNVNLELLQTFHFWPETSHLSARQSRIDSNQSGTNTLGCKGSHWGCILGRSHLNVISPFFQSEKSIFTCASTPGRPVVYRLSTQFID